MHYISLDTNILLLDANNLLTLGKLGTIILPETVLDEVDSKKSGTTEIAYQARSFGRLLAKADYIDKHYVGSNHMVCTNLKLDDITIKVLSLATYPFASTEGSIYNDRKILHLTQEFMKSMAESSTITFMTNDIMCRLRAVSLGIPTTILKDVEEHTYEFTRTLELPFHQFSNIHNESIYDIDPNYTLVNFNYVFTCPDTNQVKPCYISNTGLITVIGKETETQIRNQLLPPLNMEQLMLSRAILDLTTDVIVVDSMAGTGKTATALSNAMKLVSTNSPYDSIVYMRSSVNDVDQVEEIGFLPGSAEEKNKIYLHPLYDTLDSMARKVHSNSKLKGLDYETMITEYCDNLVTKHNIQAMTTLGLRGRTFTNSVVIVDEAQNISKSQFRKVLTRLGKNCKVIIIGSNRQIDNPYITKYNNGLSVIMDDCNTPTDIKKYAISLTKVVRSPLAEWAEQVFDQSQSS